MLKKILLGAFAPLAAAALAVGVQWGSAANAAPMPAPVPIVKDLGGVANVPTGGSFSTSKTLVGTLDLAAGSYTVSVNAKATPNAVTTGAVSPQFFVYDGPQVPPSFANDLFNVSGAALENPTSAELTPPTDLIDSYYSGSKVVTVPAGGETLDLYAFGYDSDTGHGSYKLDDLTVTAVKIKPVPPVSTVPYVYAGHDIAVSSTRATVGWSESAPNGPWNESANVTTEQPHGAKCEEIWISGYGFGAWNGSNPGNAHIGFTCDNNGSNANLGYLEGLTPGHNYALRIVPSTGTYGHNVPIPGAHVGYVDVLTTA